MTTDYIKITHFGCGRMFIIDDSTRDEPPVVIFFYQDGKLYKFRMVKELDLDIKK